MGQQMPSAIASGQIDNRMGPGLCRLGAGFIAGLSIGVARAGHTPWHAHLATGLEHFMQRRQVVALGDNGFCCRAQRLSRKLTEFVKPQIFGQIFRFSAIAKGTEILIVVVDLKQRKNLIDSIDQLRVG